MGSIGSGEIMAIVTRDKDAILFGGGVPVILAQEQAEQDRIANFLGQSLHAAVHDLENGVYILVRY